MSDNRTFVSYSRSDSEFALRLAKDLRALGAEVWLDQLDIAAGTRWDSAIEAALRGSNRVLVLLSPKAVASQNVLDEMSFALEEGKAVVPVLVESCMIPLRLRRLQYVDFTLGYEPAMTRLLATLGVAQATTPKTEAHEPRGPVANEPPIFTPSPAPSARPTTFVGIAAAILVVAGIATWLSLRSPHEETTPPTDTAASTAPLQTVIPTPEPTAAAPERDTPAARATPGPSGNLRLAPAGQAGGGGIGSGGLDLREETDLPALLTLVRQLGDQPSLSSADVERVSDARYKACPFSVDATPCSKQADASVSSLLEMVCTRELAAKSVSDVPSCKFGYELAMQRRQQNKLNDMVKRIKPG
jgi:hypothetical protein